MFPAGIYDIEHALDTDLQYCFRHAIEEFGPIYKCQVMDCVHAFDSAIHNVGITDIPHNQFELSTNIGKTALGSSRIVVDNANPVALPNQATGNSGPDETRASGDQKMLTCQCSSRSYGIFTQLPLWCERWAAAINSCTRRPSRKSGRAGVPNSIQSKKFLARRESGRIRPSSQRSSSGSSTSTNAISVAGRRQCDT